MQDLIGAVAGLSPKERKALAVLLKQKGINLFSVAPIFKRQAEEPVLLSYAQERQWFLWQLDPDSAAYHMSMALRLQGSLDVAALGQWGRAGTAAIARLVRTHFLPELGDGVMSCLVVPAEFRRLAPEYPILFRYDGESRSFSAMALFGFMVLNILDT